MATQKLVYEVHSSIFHTRWKPKSPPADEWINKIWYIHAMEYYWAIKWNKVLIHAIIQLNLEHIALSERSQSQETTYCTASFI